MISIVVIFHQMHREAPRTLHSLAYQLGDVDYEVIAIDHNSDPAMDAGMVRSFGENFALHRITSDSVSPVGAIAHGVSLARGEHLMIMIDGAHILSPGIMHWTSKALLLSKNPLVATVAYHLGPGLQNETVLQGYNQEREDELLGEVRWQEDGYRLFRAAGSLGDTTINGPLGCLIESNCLTMRRDTYEQIGGIDLKFQSRGGGFANLDLFARAVSRSDLDYYVLLGEGTFHQIHGGTSSNAPAEKRPWDAFAADYERLRGRPFQLVMRRPIYLGTIPQDANRALAASAGPAFVWWEEKYKARSAVEVG